MAVTLAVAAIDTNSLLRRYGEDTSMVSGGIEVFLDRVDDRVDAVARQVRIELSLYPSGRGSLSGEEVSGGS